MKKLVAVLLLILAASALWANPFGGGSPQGNTSTGILGLIADTQHHLRDYITAKAADFKSSGSVFSAAVMLFLSFIYGCVHAAGPGHNKAAVSAYAIAKNIHGLKSASIGAASGFLHGIASMLTVLTIYYLTEFRFTAAMRQTGGFFVAVSSAGLLLFGIYLFISTFREQKADRKNNLIITVISGIIPCPATFIVMSFFLSQQMVISAVACSLALTLGMAATTSAFAFTAGSLGRGSALFIRDRHRLLNRFSAVAVSLFGILLYLTH